MLLSIGMLMLSATQVYTILTVQLFAFLNLLPVEADILAVLNAQRAGYKAAIVHNVDSDDLISMGSNDIEVLKKIDIPSVFIGESSANSLKDEFTYEKGSQNLSRIDIELEETDFVKINLRSSLYINSKKMLGATQFEGDEYDVCAICLDEYEDGDKLRILPCSHAYHCKCVDPWLTKTKKTCPVCKQKVVPSQGDSDSDTDSSQEENEVSEHTPLLRPLASVSTQSFGALSESRSHQNMTESSDYEEEDNEDTDSSDAENEINEQSVVVQLQPDGEQDYNMANTV
ncbi:hypothetical protein EI555_017437 [Monodon monoceros]|uniref:RING-type domain-containing protein n=1 Tax=Monodon monoceros TaxID=40151 RepID=A0A4U1F0P0_MONMO|nr:hypothetical protein EI555_017437 [Monodon monoceros]